MVELVSYCGKEEPCAWGRGKEAEQRLTETNALALFLLVKALPPLLDTLQQALHHTLGRPLVLLLNPLHLGVKQPARDSDLMGMEQPHGQESICALKGETVESEEVGRGVHVGDDGVGEGERRRELTDRDAEVKGREDGGRKQFVGGASKDVGKVVEDSSKGARQLVGSKREGPGPRLFVRLKRGSPVAPFKRVGVQSPYAFDHVSSPLFPLALGRIVGVAVRWRGRGG